ncbi:MAG: phenylacetate-CoA oxygenase subunit PaaC [Phycisphaerales bacterium]|nr:phenylacetate-CoA oxygenase subunit PaaC [Phycisphaerales bacterium]
MTTMQNMLKNPDANLVLALADDLLMLGHVQGDWTGLGPILEEDIASSSMAQDDLSHALVLYEHLGAHFGIDADVIAYERDIADYRCCDLVTLPDEFDWAVAFVRRWVISHWAAPVLDRLTKSDDQDLAERCLRLRAEQSLHLTYLDDWMHRLGSGPDEGRTRIQTALDTIAEHAGMVMEVPDRDLADIEAFCCGREELFNEWTTAMNVVLEHAGFTMTFPLPALDAFGGRRGTHAPHFHEQHAEMTEVRCADPGATW